MDPAQVLEAREIARHRVINDTIAHGNSCIQQYYDGATVLVSGASGFLGKHLVEKLFRSCKIRKMFILIRSKKQKSIQERFDKILEDKIYDYLKDTQPDFIGKIVLVNGDMALPRLSISEEDRTIITEEVNVIFHGAATVNFNEPLKKATLINVHGTREMINLAKECKKLASFVHVSTAYTHATSSRAFGPVLEQFYDSPMAPDALIQMVQETDEAVLDATTPKILEGWPNTYAFTKAIAEEEVRIMAADLPICIVRPAIVICAFREPLPGWIDRSAVFGATGLVVGSGLGILHVIYSDGQANVDVVPVDIVNNALIAAAPETTERRARGLRDIKIYTVCSNSNPINFDKITKLISLEGRKLPSMMCAWYGYGFNVKNRYLYNILFFLIHCIPGYLFDGGLMLLGKKPILTGVYKKVYKHSDVLGYYTTREWKFEDSNLREMYRDMSPADRTIFNFDIDSFDWTLGIVLWCLGCRKYIIRDGLKDTEKAVRKQNLLRILNYLFIIFYIFVIYMIFRAIRYLLW